MKIRSRASQRFGSRNVGIIVLFFLAGFMVQPSKQEGAPGHKSNQHLWQANQKPGNRGSTQAEQGRLIGRYGNVPLSFEVNQGQTDSQVKFLSRGPGYALFLTGDEAVLALRTSKANGKRQMAKGKDRQPFARHSSLVTRHLSGATDNEQRATNSTLRMKFIGANPTVLVAGADELPGKSNYFIGNDPKKWRTNVPTYAKVNYQGVYPGVDLVYYGSQGQLEYDFAVSPGADPSAIALQLETGQSKIQNRKSKIDADGDLVVLIGGGEVRFHKPAIYQPASANSGPRTRDKKVEGRYKLVGKNRIGFEVADYDRSRPLVIDPILSYSTHLGGSNSDVGNSVAVDSSGNAYVTGQTCSTDFPTAAPEQAANAGNCDAFVTKLNAAGSALVYSTYLGGSHGDSGAGIATDGQGDAYITGLTNSLDFPTTSGAFQTTYQGGDSDAFVVKLNPTGSLVYSTYLGGGDAEQGFGIAVDSSGSASIAGQTSSGNFPVAGNAFQRVYAGNSDAFVTRLNPAGSGLIYSTYLGGNQIDAAYAIALDSLGAAFVTGSTTSAEVDFPLKNSLEDEFAGPPDFPGDAYVTKINPDGSLVYSTYLDGTGQDAGYAIAVDALGYAYVTGYTTSTDFLTISGALQPANAGGADAFVSKLSPQGSTLIYSTYLGGTGTDIGHGIAVDQNGNAYVTGVTNSKDFPTANALQPTFAGGDSDAFVAKINSSGSSLIVSTYLGGGDVDSGNAVAVVTDQNNVVDVYAAGSSASVDFPTTAGAFQTKRAGTTPETSDAFIVKLTDLAFAVPVLSPRNLTFGDEGVNTASTAQTVSLTNAGDGALTFTGINATGDFAQSNTCGASLAAGATCTISVTFTPTATGIRTGSVTVTDNAADSPQTIPLIGNGVPAPAVTTAPTQITFANQLVGTTSDFQIVKLTNTGNAMLKIASLVASSNFADTTDCGVTLAVGASCSIKITFAPTAAGPVIGSVTITDNAPGSPHVVSLGGTGTDFKVSVSPPSATVVAGNSTSYTFTVTPSFGFNAMVTLRCSGAPRGATCSVSSPTVTPNGTNPATATVTVTTATRSLAPPGSRPKVNWPRFVGQVGPLWYLAALAFTLLAGLALGRHRRVLMGLALVACLVVLWAACGGGTQVGVPAGTPAGSYTLTLSGTSATVTRNAAANLTVM